MILNRYISVCYQSKNDSGKFSEREYTYVDGVGLLPNDLVIAPTAKGDRVAKVSRVNILEDEIDSRILPILKTIESLYEEGAIEDV